MAVVSYGCRRVRHFGIYCILVVVVTVGEWVSLIGVCFTAVGSVVAVTAIVVANRTRLQHYDSEIKDLKDDMREVWHELKSKVDKG